MNKQEHIVSVIGEEALETAVELAKVCSKINRFGLHEVRVDKPEGPSNQARLVDELNDLMGIINLAVEEGIIPSNWLDCVKMTAKMAKVRHFMEYAREKGTLN